MATNIAKLKSSKGAPPPAEATPDVIAEDTRPSLFRCVFQKLFSKSFRKGQGESSASAMAPKSSFS
jgi:hypothetical protein